MSCLYNRANAFACASISGREREERPACSFLMISRSNDDRKVSQVLNAKPERVREGRGSSSTSKCAEPAVVVRREGDSRMAVLVRVARELMAMDGAAASLSILDAAVRRPSFAEPLLRGPHRLSRCHHPQTQGAQIAKQIQTRSIRATVDLIEA